MQRLVDIIVAIFGLGRAAYDNIDLDEARDFHARYIARAIWLIAALVLIMVGINYAGYKGINIGISFFLSLVVLTIATRPEPLIAAVIAGLASGAIQKPQTMLREVRSFLKTFFRSLGDVIFWISIFGMFLGTVSCTGNPRAVATIAIALIVIGYGSYRWDLGPVMYKKVIYGYAIFIFLFSLISLPSHATWMHYAGFDPISILRTSDEEELLAEVEKASAEKESDAKIAILEDIKKDIEAKRPLKEWQKTFLENMKKERDENSIPSRVTEKLSSITLSSFSNKANAYVPSTQAPAPVVYAPPAQVAVASEPESLSGNWKLKYDKDLNNTWWWDHVLIIEDSNGIKIAKQGTSQIYFEGQALGNNKYKGTWHEGPTNASATMYLSSPKNKFASGRIERDDGIIMPIQIES